MTSLVDAILVVMEPWTSEHRAFVIEAYFKNHDSVVSTQRLFRARFNIGRRGSVPCRNTIKLWVENFRRSASATKTKPPGMHRIVRTPANIERVRTAVQRSPRRSARRQAITLGLSESTVRRILHKDLHYHPYKLAIVQELTAEDFLNRLNCCNQLLELFGENDLGGLIMSDEAHFELSGYVNKQNFRYWCSENPRQLHQRPLHSRKVTVWCGVGRIGIIGPYFFEDDAGNHVTVNSQRYVEMLNTFLEPELRRRNIDLHTVWFQQDGATAHTARASMARLREMFPRRVISRNGDVPWPARSPDLTACDYWLWGYLKSKVYLRRPRTIEELKENIRNEITAIPMGTLQRVMGNLRNRLEQCVRSEGRHLSEVIFHK